MVAGRAGLVAQRPRPGQHGQPVHRGPDGVLEARAAQPGQQAGLGQFVERGAQLTQRRAFRPGPAVRCAVRVLPRDRERGGEQPPATSPRPDAQDDSIPYRVRLNLLAEPPVEQISQPKSTSFRPLSWGM